MAWTDATIAEGGATRVHSVPPAPPAPDATLVPVPCGMDWLLLGVVLLLCALGTVMIYSSSYFLAVHVMDDETYFLVRHLRMMALALVALTLGLHLPYQLWQRLAPWLLLATVTLLVLTLTHGEVRNHARRWLPPNSSFAFQPAELSKVVLVFFAARALVAKAERGVLTEFWRGLVPLLAVLGVLVALLMLQPDMGSAMVLTLLLFGMAFVAGARIGPLVAAGAPLALAAGVFIYNNPMRLERLKAWLDPFQDEIFDDRGYQLANSLLAVAIGGGFGQGLGASQRKLGFVPEAHTDFILAIVGEELGVAGISLIAGLFCVLLWRGARIIATARDEFGRLAALGIVLLMGTQAAVNFGVALQMLPTKGLTLPFISYGGTSLIVMAFAAGVLLNIGRGGRPALLARLDAWLHARALGRPANARLQRGGGAP